MIDRSALGHRESPSAEAAAARQAEQVREST